MELELRELLRLHALYLEGNREGVRADLSWAKLSWAKLSGTNLSGANLFEANLFEANLSGADLSWAKLSWANLSGANLSGANLSGATLSGADLSGANLSGANLSGATMSKASLTNTTLPNFQLPPEEGPFYAYKKVSDETVLTLYIPRSAQRTSSLVGRKCRADKVKVVKAETLEGIPSTFSEFSSRHRSEFQYKVGEWVKPDSYDPDIRTECTNGIHFFMTKKEAKEYV